MGTTEKQGIVSILRSDADQAKVPSLRRTLSADMSSKKWLGNNGISPMKKIASNLVADSSSSDEREDECDGKEPEKPGQSDVWSSILLSKKDDDESSKFSPYVHPLVKRSTSALSENSLKICTESLGSETGSEVFSSYASSLSDDPEEDKVHPQQQQPQSESLYFDIEELRVAKYNHSKKVPQKSFPPLLPSLAGCDWPALHMHSRRENGRLVLEAVYIPSQNYFHAHRKDDRLVLTFANTIDSKEPNHEGTIDQEEEVIEHVVDEVEEIFETIEDEKDCEEEEEMVKVENEEIELVMEQATKLPSGMINFHRSAFMIKKLMEDNRNTTWSNKYNKAVHFVNMEEEKEEANPQAKSLPRPPQLARFIPSPPAVAAATSFNTYEYFWRAKPIMATAVNAPNKNSCNRVTLSNSTPEAYQERGMVLLRGNKADYLVPLLRGCKESRRSLLIWEPSCIATT